MPHVNEAGNSTVAANVSNYRFVRRLWLKWLMLLACVCASVYVGFSLIRAAYDVPEITNDAYAQIWIVDALKKHMRLNNGQWPGSWEELAPSFSVMAREHNCEWTLDQLRQRVEIDFTANPDELAKVHAVNGTVPFRVIWLRSGKPGRHWEGAEPNHAIWEWLQLRRRQQGSP